MGKFFKYAESSLVMDFVAGGDPTGRATFELSRKNTKNHLAHRIAGDLGGAVVGSLVTNLVTGGTLYGAGKLLQKRIPGISGFLQTTGKQSISALNIFKAKDRISGLSKALDLTKRQLSLASKAQRAANNSSLNSVIRENPQKLLSELNAFQKQHKMGPREKVEIGGTTLAGLSTATLGGLFNAVSSDSQYTLGQQFKKKNV